MARSFNGSSNIDFGDLNALDGLSELTISYWVQSNASPVSYQFHISKVASGGANGWYIIQNTTEARLVTALRNADVGQFWLGTNGAFTLGVLHHVCLVYNGAGGSDALRHRLFVDGVEDIGGVFTNAIPASIGANAESVIIGGLTMPVLDSFAEAGLWDVALSDPEVAALFQGVTPDQIRPLNLLFYCPVWGVASAEQDLVGGAVGTLTGTAYAEHPRVIPAPAPLILPASGAAPPAAFLSSVFDGPIGLIT